jgi:hypothetical protein
MKRIFDIFLYHRLSNDKIDAIATANILNFIGLSINNFRNSVVQKIFYCLNFLNSYNHMNQIIFKFS